MIVTVELGAATDDSAETVNRLCLLANQALMILDGLTLYLHPETGNYCLLCRLDVASLDFIAFDKIMGTILDRAEQWGALLQKIIPLASGSAADKESAPPMAGWDAIRQMGNITFA